MLVSEVFWLCTGQCIVFPLGWWIISLNSQVDSVFAELASDKRWSYAVSKSYCPYCKSTKKLFDDMKVEYHVDELDQMGADGASIQDVRFDLPACVHSSLLRGSISFLPCCFLRVRVLSCMVV